MTGCTGNPWPSNACIASYLHILRLVLITYPAPARTGDKMSEPIPAEIAEVIKSASSTTGSVKTLTDLKLEGFEKRLAELEKTNAELRQANAELYAFAQAHVQVQPEASVQTVTTGAPGATLQPQAVQYVSAQPVQDEVKIEQQKAREDALFSGVMAEMNKNKSSNINKTDGM